MAGVAWYAIVFYLPLRWMYYRLSTPEVVALIKTRAEHFDAIAEAVRETVAYTNFVGQLEVTRVNEAFAAWLDSVVRPSPAP